MEFSNRKSSDTHTAPIVNPPHRQPRTIRLFLFMKIRRENKVSCRKSGISAPVSLRCSSFFRVVFTPKTIERSPRRGKNWKRGRKEKSPRVPTFSVTGSKTFPETKKSSLSFQKSSSRPTNFCIPLPGSSIKKHFSTGRHQIAIS